jgi:hypothetical protein
MQEYTIQEKRRAIALAGRLGPMEAGRRLGIPDGTLSCWCFKAREAKRNGGVWPSRRPGAQRTSANRRKTDLVSATHVGPRLISAEIDTKPERTSDDVSWELETERGAVLRVRRTIESPELERVLTALLPAETSR